MKRTVLHRTLLFSAVFFAYLFLSACFSTSVSAEGSRELCEGASASVGYRPYTERNSSETAGEVRDQVIKVYMKQGETVCFGTSVSNAKLGFTNAKMGTALTAAELTALNDNDILIMTPSWDSSANSHAYPYINGKKDDSILLYNVAENPADTTRGYIADYARETAGPNLGTETAGYAPFSYKAEEPGVYCFKFFSENHDKGNPEKVRVTAAWNQRGNCVAAWDTTVVGTDGKVINGRTFTDTLFLNMGQNGSNGESVLMSKVYAVTGDGYQYLVNFNGLDPYGFVFFANNRGLLDSSKSGSIRSLYHSVKSLNNQLSDLSAHSILLNNLPYDPAADQTYSIFFNKPDSTALEALGIGNPDTSGSVSDFKFTGNADGTGYVGKGGTFSFSVDTGKVTATSYQITLDFTGTGGGKVVLSNTLSNGKNSIFWNGKDANGKYVPAGTYTVSAANVELKGGEVHFPLLDAESNPRGLIIGRINGTGASEASPDYTVHYNNSGSSNIGDATAPWSPDVNWNVADKKDETAGVSSASGAMVYTNKAGDQTALDIWANYSSQGMTSPYSFTLTAASFTVTKTWNRSGISADNKTYTDTEYLPQSVTMTLKDGSGNVVTADAAGDAITNPVTWNTSSSVNYTWTALDPAKTYSVTENAVAGYQTAYGNVTGNASDGYAQTVTNTYQPTYLVIKKVWDHGSQNQADWPTSVTVNITGKNAAGETKYTNNGYTVTGDTSKTTWTSTIYGLDPSLTYSLTEDTVSGYDSAVFGPGGTPEDGYGIYVVNIYNSSSQISLAAFKYWKDSDDTYRPSSVTMTLCKADGTPVDKDANGNAITNPVTLSDANDWYTIWPNMSSTENYTLKENSVPGYTAEAEKLIRLNHFAYLGIDNTPQLCSFTVTKSWNHGINTEASRQPSAVMVHLQQSLDGGKTYTDTGKSAALTAAGSWTASWTDLPGYLADGTKILYKAYEDTVPNYRMTSDSAAQGSDGNWKQTILNTYEYTKVSVTKTWDYGAQPEADRPNSATVFLNQNGKQLRTCTLSSANSWSYTFDDLAAYDESGNAIVYTLTEDPVDHYAVSGGTLSGSAADGYTASFKNTYGSNLTTLTIQKTWNCGAQDPADYPAQAVFRLYMNGSATDITATLNAANSWTWTFTGLLTGYTYTVVEDEIANYTPAYSADAGSDDAGHLIKVTNTYDPTTTFTVTKVWEHGTQSQSAWPSSVTVHLYQEGKDTGLTVTLNAANGWTAQFTKLPKYKSSGAKYEYRVYEDTVSNYRLTSSVTNFSKAGLWTATLTNTYKASSNRTSASSTGTSSRSSGSSGSTASTSGTGASTGDATPEEFPFEMMLLLASAVILWVFMDGRKRREK